MLLERIQKLFRARPFQPFIIHLEDGRTIPVHDYFMMGRSPDWRTIAVYQPDGKLDIIRFSTVTDVEVMSNASASSTTGGMDR